MTQHGGSRAGRHVAVLVATGALLAACSNGSGNTSSTTTTRPPPTSVAARPVVDDHLAIGVLLPQSGAGAAFGAPLIDGVKLAADEINAAGGVNGQPITLTMGNEGSDPGEASIALDALLKDGVDAIVGPASSRIAANLLATTVRANVPVCSPTATAIELDDFPDHDLFFRTVPSDSLQAMALAAAVVETGRSNIAVLFADDDYGSQFAASLRNALTSRQVSIQSSVGFDPNSTALKEFAAQAMAKGPDVVALIANADAGSRMLDALRAVVHESGSMMPSIFVNDAMRTPAVLTPTTAADRVFVRAIHGTSPEAIPESQEFSRDFERAYPGTPVDYSAYAYDCLMTIALAAQSTRSDLPKAIAGAMVGVTTLGVPCRGFEGCAHLLDDSFNINLDGASGALDLDAQGDVTNASFDEFAFESDGRDLTTGSVFVSR